MKPSQWEATGSVEYGIVVSLELVGYSNLSTYFCTKEVFSSIFRFDFSEVIGLRFLE